MVSISRIPNALGRCTWISLGWCNRWVLSLSNGIGRVVSGGNGGLLFVTHPVMRNAIKLVVVGLPFVLLLCCPPDCQGFAVWHTRRPMPWQCYSSIVILSARRLVTFGLSLPVKGHTLLLSMRCSTRWSDLSPQNKHQMIRIKISSHYRNSPLLL